MASMPNDAGDLIPTAEAAELLGISVWGVRRLVLNGSLVEAIKLPGKRGARLFRRGDIAALRSDASVS